jgi:hypothetical protein
MQNSGSLGSSGMTNSMGSEMFQSAVPHEYEPASEPERGDDAFPFASAVAQGNPAPEPEYQPVAQGARLADDPGRQMHESYMENPRGSRSSSTSLPSPPDEIPFVNNPERWQQQQQQQQQEAQRRASQDAGDVEGGRAGGGSSDGGGAGNYDSRWVEDVSRMASEKGSEAVEGAMSGGREVYRRYQAGEITQEVVCVGVATLVFIWFLYWLVLHMHWSLQWVLLVILILFTLRTCCGVTDLDRWILEPMHREFPELTENIVRLKQRAERKIHSWRGGRAAQMGQGLYGDENGGSDDEDAPLLSRSSQGGGEEETMQEELERLRRESLMTSQELSRARDEIDNLRRSGGGGGGGMRGGGFDSGRGNQMEEL